MDFSKFKEYYTKNGKFKDHFQNSVILLPMTAQGGLSVADGCRCLTKELDMIAC